MNAGCFRWALMALAIGAAGCGNRLPEQTAVKAFARTVARDITRDGPAAWQRYFADSPAFFMASEGHLVFPDSATATTAIHELARTIRHMELQWGEDLRVDPLAPGLAMVAASWHEVRVDQAGGRVDESGFFTGVAESRNGSWRFRDAHWSVATPPPAVR